MLFIEPHPVGALTPNPSNSARTFGAGAAVAFLDIFAEGSALGASRFADPQRGAAFEESSRALTEGPASTDAFPFFFAFFALVAGAAFEAAFTSFSDELAIFQTS